MGFILASIFMLDIPKAEGAIVYRDVDPDFTYTQIVDGVQSYPVDLNGDLTIDFMISVSKGVQTLSGYSFSGDAVVISPEESTTGNSVLTDGSAYKFARALVLNDAIENTSTTWDGDGGVLAATGMLTISPFPAIPVTGGNYPNTTDKYIGVQFLIGANVHYGWIRVDVSGYNSFTIKDFAYEDVAGQSILAGAGTTTGISESINANTTIKNNNYAIIVEFAKTFTGKVDMVNMSGQIVKSLNVNGNSCTIEKAALSTGIYNLVITGQEGFATRKVAVQ